MKLDRYVAFFDIMGFKNLIFNNNMDIIKKIYEIIDVSADSSISHSVMHNIDMEEVFKDANKLRSNINSSIISDSIIFWTNDNTDREFINLIKTSNSFISMMYMFDIPVRGAIDYGDILVQNRKQNHPARFTQRNTIVGKPLVNAYIASESQNWTGSVICNGCFDFITKEHPKAFEQMENEKRIIKYNPPLKEGKIVEMYVLNWIYHILDVTDVDLTEIYQYTRRAFSGYGKSIDNWDVEMKIRNTEIFRDYVFSTYMS